jgi:hypothetical protein
MSITFKYFNFEVLKSLNLNFDNINNLCNTDPFFNNVNIKNINDMDYIFLVFLQYNQNPNLQEIINNTICYFITKKKDDGIWIYNVCTKKEHRKKNLMKTLFQLMFDFYYHHNETKFKLGVLLRHEQNMYNSLISFYASIGFKNAINVIKETIFTELTKIYPYDKIKIGIQLNKIKNHWEDSKNDVQEYSFNYNLKKLEQKEESLPLYYEDDKNLMEAQTSYSFVYNGKTFSFDDLIKYAKNKNIFHDINQWEGTSELQQIKLQTHSYYNNSEINIHTHPYIGYIANRCYIAPPSTQDIVLLIRACKNNTKKIDIVLTAEGIYFYTLGEEFKKIISYFTDYQLQY